jgi:cytochrome b6-f complex iron-sulfur subunit
MSSEEQTRRQFCRHVCQAASLATLGGALAVALEGCGGGNPAGSGGGSFQTLPILNGTLGNGSISVAVDATSPLAAVGSAALVQSPVGYFLVAHTGQDAFSALTANCTHQACVVSGYRSGTFVCPCHGSQFTTDGRVVAGPAPTALRQYATQFSSGVVTVAL